MLSLISYLEETPFQLIKSPETILGTNSQSPSWFLDSLLSLFLHQESTSILNMHIELGEQVKNCWW